MSDYSLGAGGRAVPQPDFARFQSLYPADLKMYFKDWSSHDLALALDAAKPGVPFIIGTHRIDQIIKIPSVVAATTIGITYPRTMFPLVIKNWCKKNVNDSTEMHQIYFKDKRALFNKLQTNNLIGPYILKQQITANNCNIPKYVDHRFDIALELEDILNHNLSAIDSMLDQDAYQVFDEWYSSQDCLYKQHISSNQHYVACLGSNQKVSSHSDLPIRLSDYDQILVANYCKVHSLPAPKVVLTTELVKFFESISCNK